MAAKTMLFKHYRDSKDNNFEDTHFVFNEEGDVIYTWSVNKSTNESYNILGDRIYTFDRDSNSLVMPCFITVIRVCPLLTLFSIYIFLLIKHL